MTSPTTKTLAFGNLSTIFLRVIYFFLAGPSWLTGEGIVLPIYPDTQMVKLAESVAKAHPELKAYPSRISGGVTEMTDSIRAGVPAITLMGLTRQNVVPNWHTPGDTVDKMDPDALRVNYAFAWHFIQAFDRKAA